MAYRRHWLGLLLVCAWLGGSLIPVSWFISTRICSGHDCEFQPLRAMAVCDAWACGVLVPRWCPTLAGGLGYPIFNYYGWLPYGLAALLHLGGLSPVAASNAVFVVSGLLLAAGAWLLGRELGGRKGAWVTWALYSYAPYQLVNLYVRASLSEYFGGALAPWALWGMVRTVRSHGWTGPAVAVGSLSLLIFSHNISAYSVGAVVALVGLALALSTSPAQRKGALGRVALVLGFALLTSMHFWLPLIAGLRDANIARVYSTGYSYYNHLLYPHQLLARTWDFGFSRKGLPDSMSFQLGPGIILAVFMFALMLIDRRADMGRVRGLVHAFMLPALALCYVMTYQSAWLWKLAPPLYLLQFPWRLLLPTTLLVSAGGAVLSVYYLPRMWFFRATAVHRLLSRNGHLLLVLVAIATSLPYCCPKSTKTLSTEDLEQKLARTFVTTTLLDEYLPSGVEKRDLVEPLVGSQQMLVGGKPSRFVLADSCRGRVHLEAHISLDEPAQVSFPVFCFPGWQVTDSRASRRVYPSPGTGLLSVDLPAGQHHLAAQWTSTRIQWIANLGSLLAMAAFALWLRRAAKSAIPHPQRCPSKRSRPVQTSDGLHRSERGACQSATKS